MSKRLERNKEDKILGGVCSGLADYFGTDPMLLRAVFLLIVFIGGGGIFVYVLLWVVIPEQNGTIPESNPQEQSGAQAEATDDPDTFNNSMGLILLTAGILLLVNNLIPGFNVRKFWPVLLVVVGGGLLFGQKSKKVPSDSKQNEEPK